MNGIEPHANPDQESVIEQILDDQIDINSAEEFENLLCLIQNLLGIIFIPLTNMCQN